MGSGFLEVQKHADVGARKIVTQRSEMRFLGSASDQVGRDGDVLQPEDVSQERGDRQDAFLGVAAEDEYRSFGPSRRIDGVSESLHERFPGDDV